MVVFFGGPNGGYGRAEQILRFFTRLCSGSARKKAFSHTKGCSQEIWGVGRRTQNADHLALSSQRANERASRLGYRPGPGVGEIPRGAILVKKGTTRQWIFLRIVKFVQLD